MLKITDITFPFSLLNNGAENGILVDVAPYYAYENGQKTEKLEGYKYVFILHQRDFEKISIKVQSGKPVITSEQLSDKSNNIMAKPVNCKAKFYFNPKYKNYALTATADSIELEV